MATARKRSSTKAKCRGLYIFDPDVVDLLAKVEGQEWARHQRSGRAGGYGVPAFVAAWQILASDLRPGEKWHDNINPSHLDGPSSDGTIYGDGGYARYIVTGDGEVVLLASTTRQAKVDKAVAAGRRSDACVVASCWAHAATRVSRSACAVLR